MKIIFSKNVRLALWLLALPLLGVFSQAQAQTSSAPFGPITYLHNDVTGNVMLATNSSGAIVWEERYLPYGAKRLGAAGGVGGVTSSGQRYGYHNKSLDPETGLQYFGGRYYDPLTGRFSAMDPAPSGNPDIYAFNRYSFANGNPYTFTDPNGRNVFSIVDWGTFAHDVGGLLVTEIVYTAAVLQGNNAVASMAIEEMASQRADAAFSTVGIISPVPKTG